MTVLVGGIIPEADRGTLKALGIDGVFPPGTAMPEIIEFINEHVQPRAGVV